MIFDIDTALVETLNACDCEHGFIWNDDQAKYWLTLGEVADE